MKKHSIWKNSGFQSIIAAVACIILGLFIGFLVLLAINREGAWEGIITIVRNFFNYPTGPARLRYLGNTLVRTAPLLMCALSVQFCYKVGLFNIGAAGQYVVGAGASLYCALALHLPWFVCVLAACAAGAVYGSIVGILKAYRNVNEVISGIMLNWIGLYCVNMLLTGVKESTSPYTINIQQNAPESVIPDLGLGNLFSANRYVTIAIVLSVVFAIVIWVIQNKTMLGYELRATGFNKDAAKYAGMKEKKNIILTLAIGGGLAGIGASFLYLSGYEQWSVTQSSVPGMGFNGIAATFLGGLDPIGTIFASYFIQHITSGGSYLDKRLYPSQISDLISAIIIYLCGFVLFFKSFMNARIAAREERAIEEVKEEAEEKEEAAAEAGGDRK